MLLKRYTVFLSLLFAIMIASPVLGQAEYYVTSLGSDSAAGTNWPTALLTIGKAVDKALTGDTVLVSNGTYSITAQIPITNGVALRSVNGAEVTTITRSSGTCRILYLSHENAVVDGFTISDGSAPGPNNSMGGGILIDYQGTVSNCVITGNKIALNCYGSGIALNEGGYVRNCRIIENGGFQMSGGGVYLYKGGVVEDCEIAGNFLNYSANGGAGAFLDRGGLLRNCVITNNIMNYFLVGNIGWPVAGGVGCSGGGTVESCTIAGNYSQSVGGLVCKNGGSIRNTIVAGNRSGAAGSPNYMNTGTGWSYANCCTVPMVTGTDNVGTDPQFAGPEIGDMRLLAGSPCIDAGSNQTWMASASDQAGNPRIFGARVDIGAYEFNPNIFTCNLIGTPPLIALASNRVGFTAAVAGPDQTGLYYQWDFENDGIVDIEGYDQAVVTNLYGPGLHSVRLVISNDLDEVATQVRPNLIHVGPVVAHVVPTNTEAAPPYATWATAATDIQSAINAGVDGTLVLVSNGLYQITNQIDLEKGITLRSVTGAANTTVKRKSGKCRILYISHTNAVVDGFTITDGLLNFANFAPGGGVLIDSFGTVNNCIIKNNKLGTNHRGGGIALNMGGTVKNSLIISNGNNQVYGGGAYLHKGGVIENCEIYGNIASIAFTGSKGGGVWMEEGGLLRNCLIRNNLCQAGTAGGVYFTSSGSVENCTIVSNDSSQAGGVYCLKGGTLLNSIVYFNESDSPATDNYVTSGTGWTFTNCCTTPAVAGTGNIDDDPLFINPPYNYRLKQTSPCFNAGLNQPWMDTATDLDGLPRLQATKVDIGAYEIILPTGTRLIVR